MKQRAVTAGVIGRRFIEAGETFDHDERMNWAVPVAERQAEPDKKPGKGKGKAAETDPPAEDVI